MYSELIGTTLDQLATRGLACRTLSSAAVAVTEVAETTWNLHHVQVVLQHPKKGQVVVLAERGQPVTDGDGQARRLSLGTLRSMACQLVLALPEHQPDDTARHHLEHDLALFASQAKWLLAGVDRIENVYLALTTRSTIAQAQGILMAAYDLGSNEALLVLKRRSQETQTRLADLAAALVDAEPERRLDLLR